MVRLRSIIASIETPPILYFNSTMVRLRFAALLGRGRKIIFQFHNGAIKIQIPQEEGKAEDDFNSTMVRLR